MAEGGRPPDLNRHLLECSICIKRLRQPKSLPCLHTFCQECLGTYITKKLPGKRVSQTSFPCPICRKITSPVNQSESKEKWAEQFPINAVIQDLIQLKERSTDIPYCTPCQSKGTPTNPAKFWCKTLNLDLCEECKVQHHDVLHRSCDIIDVTCNDFISRRQEELTPTCEKHKELVTWYCEDHKQLGCRECIIEYHRQCEDVKKAKDYIEKLRNGTQLEDLENMLKKGTEAMKSFVKYFDEQIESLKQNQEVALKSIADLRQRIEVQLNELQKDVTDRLVARNKKEKMTMRVSQRQCERLMNGMLNTATSSVKAVEDNNHIEAIVSYLRGQAEVESCKELIKEMKESLTSVNIFHQIPDPSAQFTDMLGRIVIEKQARHCPSDLGFLSVPLIARQVKEIGKFNVKIPDDEYDCCIRGLVYLPDNNIVVCDCENFKLKLFTGEGQYLYKLTLPRYPRDMCLITYDTVAVTGRKVGVRVVKVEDSKLSLLRVINTTSEYLYGITQSDGRFVISDGGGRIYSLTEGGKAGLIHNYHNTCWCLAHDTVTGDTIVSVDTNTTGDAVVSRLSADKRHTAVMKVGGVVIGAGGIDVDGEGNIYMCGNASDNVVQMSWDGTRVRGLLTSADGIKCPMAIAVRGEKFVVSNLNTHQVENEYIRVFQLH